VRELEGLPEVGQLVTVREVGFGGREVTGRVVAGEGGGPLLEASPSGVQVVRLEREDGSATFAVWTDDPAKARYYLHGEASGGASAQDCAEVFGEGEPQPAAPRHEDPADRHPDQQPRTRWRRADRPWRDRAPQAEPEAVYEPLTQDLLAAEEAARMRRVNGEDAKAKAKAEAAQARAEGPSWEERAARATAIQEKKVRAASKAVREAQRSLRKAEGAYYQEAPPNDEEAQDGLFDAQVGLNPDAAQERDLRALLAAQETSRHARDHLAQVEQAAPLAILREATAGWQPPAWAWVVLALGLLVLGIPAVLIALALFVGLPIFAFWGALRM